MAAAVVVVVVVVAAAAAPPPPPPPLAPFTAVRFEPSPHFVLPSSSTLDDDDEDEDDEDDGDEDEDDDEEEDDDEVRWSVESPRDDGLATSGLTFSLLERSSRLQPKSGRKMLSMKKFVVRWTCGAASRARTGGDALSRSDGSFRSSIYLFLFQQQQQQKNPTCCHQNIYPGVKKTLQIIFNL